MKKTMKMKTTFMQCLMLLMVAMASMTALSSCHKDDEVAAPEPTPQPAKPSTYTIMLYGCGGGNLDSYLDFNLSQLDAHGKTDRINFTGLVKFSESYQEDVTTQGTRLYTLTNEGMKNEKVHEADFRMDNPANLSQFIKDTQQKMPADKYILIFWNHGEEFGLSDELPENKDYTNESRSILFDDNVGGESMSVYEVEKGIKDSGIKMDLIYMDLCDYGMAEVYYQLKDCAKYMMAASAPTPGIGGNYTELVEDLQENDSLEDAIKAYVPNCVKSWQNAGMEAGQLDLECYDLSYMDEFATHCKNAVDEIKTIAQKAAETQKKLDKKLGKGLIYDDFYGKYTGLSEQLHIFDGNEYSVDIYTAFSRMGSEYLNGNLYNHATLMKRVIDKMTIARASIYTPMWMTSVSMGLAWPTNAINQSLDDIECLKDNLETAAFYKVTGWGDFLLNNRFPVVKKATTSFGETYTDLLTNTEYQYNWKFEISADLSSLDESTAEELKGYIEYYQDLINQKGAQYTCPLSLAKFDIQYATKLFATTLGYYHLESNGIKQFKMKMSIIGDADPSDRNLGKYPTELEETYTGEE